MNYFDLIGTIGIIFLAICWIPETVATIKRGSISVKKSFLTLYLLGSVMLLIQAIGLNNYPLIFLNSFTSLTSLVNLYYGIKPKNI